MTETTQNVSSCESKLMEKLPVLVVNTHCFFWFDSFLATFVINKPDHLLSANKHPNVIFTDTV